MQSGSNLEHRDLTFERASNTGALRSFKCGQAVVDGYIADLDSFLASDDLFLVKSGDEVVALFCLKKDDHELFLNDEIKEKMKKGIKPRPLGALDEFRYNYRSRELSLLAVKEEYQGNLIGSFIIEQVMERLVQEGVPEREFLIVRALCLKEYSAVPFYQKCGFTPAQEWKEEYESLMMYRVIDKQS